MDLEVKETVNNFLCDSGCCKRCVVRLTGNGDSSFDIEANSSQNGETEHNFKKTKLNPCIICLDLLSDSTLESMITDPELEKLLDYDCETFVNFISYPKSLLIRDHSMQLFAKEKFPDFFKDRTTIALNRAWSLSIQNKIAKLLNKTFDKDSNLQIQFNTSYELDKEESAVMYKLDKNLKKNNSNNDLVSSKGVIETLRTISSDIFKKNVSVPPETPTMNLILDKMTFKHEYIYIAGRYCKYARNLFQTPWLGDETEVAVGSVQEIIFEALNNIFNCSTMIFSSSGREDCDVRTLGRGRPFFIKICDPKITKISAGKFRSIEKAIKKTKIVKVRDLQFIDKKYVNNIKEGEQFKKKTYRTLCIIDKPENLQSYIDKINSIQSDLKLQQKTPLRVYHRRSADVRERYIYSLKARAIKNRNNLIELDMVTQAGTYVKEFVHGDFGRTSPSLSDIIGGRVDIVALDVLDIDLDFPPSLT